MSLSATTPDTVASTPASPSRRRFGMFEGVFTPTLLTILGVIMYLREGWVVGQVGLLGAWAIIGGASIITASTALSLSSIATNVQLDAGGPYAIIARSLGLELGGSVGIPQYLSQALAVAMYIFGLREGWMWIFPGHPALVVDLAALVVVFTLGYISASLAFRVQYVVMAIIAGSLVSAFAALPGAPVHEVVWWRGTTDLFRDAPFWAVFAVFFPATTGIMAGANMSGELKNPRRSIPVGTLGAVALGTVVYLALAYWFARMASPQDLRDNFTIMIDRSVFGPIVLAGLLGATFSSALSSMVGAPRILNALAATGTIPKIGWLVSKGDGEPRRATVVTGIIVLLALLLRDLNAVAPLITLFFLITYAMINVVVLLEQRLAVVSFRPRLRVPQIVPLVGAVGCLFAMFVVNAVFSLIAVAVVIVVYGLLMRRKLVAKHDDVRSGLFLMLAEWAARHATRLPKGQAKAWKANLLVPVVEETEVLGNFSLVVDLTKPYGSITLLGIGPEGTREELRDAVEKLADDFTHEGVHTTATVLESDRVGSALVHAMQTLRSAFLRPNLLFLTPLATTVDPTELEAPMRAAKDNRMGVVVAALHPQAALGRRRVIHVWVRQQGPDWSFDKGLERSNLNLQVLVPYLLDQRWDASLHFICAVREDEAEAAKAYLDQLLELARMPVDATAEVMIIGDLDEALAAAPVPDLNVFGLPDEGELEFVLKMVKKTRSACLFLRDSGDEDALA
jgi:amino acid transporter